MPRECDRTRQFNDAVRRRLAAAVDRAGKPRRSVAAEVGIHRDTLHRILSGESAVSAGLAARILEACGEPPVAGLLLAMGGQAGRLDTPGDSSSGEFLERLMLALPGELDAALGERGAELRPAWAIGSARLFARMLARHVDDIAERAANPHLPR